MKKTRRLRLQHKSGKFEGFTKRYRINRLVYYEEYKYVWNAIRRGKQIKGLDRKKRTALIESMNPTWEDLAANRGQPIAVEAGGEIELTADPSPTYVGS